MYQSYGDQTNIKITTKEDLDMFEGYVMMCQKRDMGNARQISSAVRINEYVSHKYRI